MFNCKELDELIKTISDFEETPPSEHQSSTTGELSRCIPIKKTLIELQKLIGMEA
jgi:hypothetical protein